MQDGRYSPRNFFLLLLLALCLVGATASAQNVWETTSYQKWTKGEVKELLTASPWAKSVKYTIPLSSENGSLRRNTTR